MCDDRRKFVCDLPEFFSTPLGTKFEVAQCFHYDRSFYIKLLKVMQILLTKQTITRYDILFSILLLMKKNNHYL